MQFGTITLFLFSCYFQDTMYKKISITILIISPLFFLFIGYPILSTKPKTIGTGISSNRCYEVGNTKQFINCFNNHQRVNGARLIQQTIERVNDLQPGMGYLLLGAVVLQLIFLIKIVNNRKA